MYGKFLKHRISQQVAPIEALFTLSPPAFDGLHDDIKKLSLDAAFGSYKETAVAK